MGACDHPMPLTWAVALQEVNRLKRMNESLGESKAELQRSMMREVADVRAQVRLLEKENEQLREWRPLPTVRNSVAEVSAHGMVGLFLASFSFPGGGMLVSDHSAC